MRVLVCGGRFCVPEYVMAWLSENLHSTIRDWFGDGVGVAAVIHGDAKGADKASGRWALEQGIPVYAFPADWQKHGRAAGPIRNLQMLAEGQPDLVVAFPGGRGTGDMVARAMAAGIPVLEVEP